MSFSIIIPTLNEEHTIQKCLLDLQKHRHIAEIIIVDGGSTDKTCTKAKKLSDKIISSAKGRAKQMNNGAKHATGKTLIFLHADTFLPENALDLILSTTKEWGRFNITLDGSAFMLKIIALFMNWRSRVTGIATGDQAIFINKKLFNKVGGYPEIALMEDISLCKKLIKTHHPACFTSKVTSSGRRWEHFGIAKTILLMWTIRLRFYFGEDTEALSILYSRGLFWKP